MNFKELSYNVFKSLNPESYNELLERKLSSAFKYFLFLLFISFLLFILILMPVLYSIPSYFDSKVANFEELNINFSFKLKEPFYIVESPAVRVEQSGSNLTNARILITEDGIFYRSFFYFGEKKVIPLKDHYDITQEKNRFVKTLLFILPSIIFWATLFFIFYISLIIIFTVIIAFIILMFINYRIGFVKVLKIALYCSTILVFTQLLLLPFIKSLLLPLAAYWLLIILVLFLYKDEKKVKGVNVSDYDEKPYKKKGLDYSSEKGSVVKKKKSFNEENEGYIEWK
ncbi:MAG: DUF1189 family protein [Candidatus Woesearchaeota archaeon]